MKRITFMLTGCLIAFGFSAPVYADTTVADKAAQIALGEKLYNDVRLSAGGNQSCATCHNPNPKGQLVIGTFADDRRPTTALTDAGWPAWVPPPVSKGSHPTLFGGRNTPSSAYAAFSPAFGFNAVTGLYVGGQFWDGREPNLAGQAAGPFRNPVEMAMADKKAVVLALQADPAYQTLFATAYATEDGAFDLNQVDTGTNQGALEAYDLVAKAIGEFEKTQLFNKFNSRYDYYLAGLGSLTPFELKGLALFEGQAKCSLCHTSQPAIAPDGGPMPPLFTDYSYDNLGVPKNSFIEVLNGPQLPDKGLGAVVGDPLQDGKFKVMTLRNIAITAPYTHNGVFKNLKQVIHFYNTRDLLAVCAGGNTDPGFGVTCWPAPDVAANMNVVELGNLGLTNYQEDALIAFLKTLTDRDLAAYAPVFAAAKFPPMP